MPSAVQTPGNQAATNNGGANPPSNLPYVKTLSAELKTTIDDSVIATCTAHLVERGDDPSRFQERMTAAAEEPAELAKDLFTPHGRLLPEHRTPQTAMNGVVDWGDALDTNDVLVFEHIKVAKAFRRKGLGKDLVQEILDKVASDGKPFSVFVAPGALESEYGEYTGEKRKEVIKEQVDICVQFWCNLGFRRVKMTNWLALKFMPCGRA
ncbi:unnamed protein product [Clonostachys solani]|uniref:N-acetyltransferase domain-containing protein n=1 Tax=Clonostachys solani TaxID=160281 RepID=A0A9P0EKU0_9HYPO|nr:unnamed protein product [Clonostachys solani]